MKINGIFYVIFFMLTLCDSACVFHDSTSQCGTFVGLVASRCRRLPCWTAHIWGYIEDSLHCWGVGIQGGRWVVAAVFYFKKAPKSPTLGWG